MRTCSESVLQNQLPYVLSWLLCPREGEAQDFTCQNAVQVGSFLSGDHKYFHPLRQGFKTPMLVAFTDIVRLIRALSMHIYRVQFIVYLYKANSLVPQEKKFLYFSTKILGCRKSILQLIDNHFFSILSNPALNYRESEVISDHRAGEAGRKPTQTKTVLVRFPAGEKCFPPNSRPFF